MWELRKIIVDDPGKAGDGSDAKIHSEIIIKDEEGHVRAKLAELNIVPQYTVANCDLVTLKNLLSFTGHMLRALED